VLRALLELQLGVALTQSFLGSALREALSDQLNALASLTVLMNQHLSNDE
jgi:hypothetical protein